VTALTGPIGFVGLIVPHALRLKFGADHRVLLPCSFLAGAAFLCLCDTLSRTVIAPTEIPVGVLTALAGGPFFIWLLRSRRKSLWL
jgi:iron complex transport system permease protein